jgi:hypothetical protein
MVDKVTTGKAVYDQKEPYTDEEITTILDQASQLDGGTHGYAKQAGTFRPFWYGAGSDPTPLARPSTKECRISASAPGSEDARRNAHDDHSVTLGFHRY